VSPEDIEQVSVHSMGFVSQPLVDNITALLAQAWDEGFAAKEAAMRDPHGTGWEPNPYRTEPSE
jgi:hypothetical protein